MMVEFSPFTRWSDTQVLRCIDVEYFACTDLIVAGIDITPVGIFTKWYSPDSAFHCLGDCGFDLACCEKILCVIDELHWYSLCARGLATF